VTILKLIDLSVQTLSAGSIRDYFAELGLIYAVLFVLPFVGMLLSIALLPLITPHWWHSNRNKALVALLFGVPIALWFVVRDAETLVHTLLEYGAFISLLGSLFVISGGIHIRGSFAGRPVTNVAFYATGAILANFIGTTGSSMLLIRPLIRANRARRHQTHVVIFFIFIVSNCAGLLTPLGDPPLFLGFLRGVEFSWPLRLWPQWLVMVGALIGVFYLVDSVLARKESLALGVAGGAGGPPPQDSLPLTAAQHAASGANPGPGGEARDTFGIEGAHNFLFLAMIIGLILLSGYVIYPLGGPTLLGDTFGSVVSKLVQLTGMAAIAASSYLMTARKVRQKNEFGFGPIAEVAVVFAGIFVTMIPALLILETRGVQLGLERAWHYFWATGILSSVLDNAPTYLVFSSLAKGTLGIHAEGLQELAADPTGTAYLAAIATGAVFMGANTYIGNGPNFMVRAIAEEAKVRMPSFFGYMVWSMAVLVPLYLLITVIFF
jgi:Na+/H+ antiporter NhaD/arsenite permease-like protein